MSNRTCPECRKLAPLPEAAMDRAAWRTSHDYRSVALDRKALSNGLCEVCALIGIAREAHDLHHIDRVWYGHEACHPSLTASLCRPCHRMVHGEVLFRFERELIRQQPPQYGDHA